MFQDGQRLGEFEILSRIGQGGMGAVYKARQVSLKRFVALKTLQASLASDPEYIARFHREAIAAASLMHPNLVQVFSAGENDGMHWFAMEYVEGESAQARVKRKGRLDAAEAIAIGIHIATALEYGWRKAHLIHRDIKPDNIFLSSDGEVKLGDLGLAKSAGETISLTMTGAAMGTPHYVSPEQGEGKKDVDLRADIYSLGCTLFHLVAGKPPYGGDTALAVMMKHVTAPIPNPQHVWPAFPAELGRVVVKMMAKTPPDRQQTYAEVLADLRRAYDEITTVTVPQVVAVTQQRQKPPPPPRPKPKAAPAVDPSGPTMIFPSPDAQSAPQSAAPTSKFKPALIAAVVAVLGIAAWFAFGKREPHLTDVERGAKSKEQQVAVSPSPSTAEPWQDMLRDPSALHPGEAKPKFTAQGMQTSGKGVVMLQTSTCRDGALRISTSLGADGRGNGIRAWVNVQNDKFYSLSISSSNVLLKPFDLVTKIDKLPKTLGTFPVTPPLQPGQAYELELRCVGERFTVKLNGKVLGEATDPSFKEGKFGVLSVDSDAPPLVKAIEFLNLDAPAAVSPSPAPQVSQSSEKFPPGQWVKVFSKAEDLPEELRKPDSEVTWEDGWIHFSTGSNKKLYLLPADLKANYAVRARFKGEQVPPQSRGFLLRDGTDESGQPSFYNIGLSPRRELIGMKKVGTTYPFFIQAQVPPALLASDGINLIEVGMVGDRVVGRVGNAFVKMVTHSHVKTGRCYIRDSVPVRDIEVINLDGLPEAEALRLLGVDEKGNDVRGKTGAVSPSPAPEVSKSSEKFPPGQWVKVFTKFEEWPMENQTPGKAPRVENGWLVPTSVFGPSISNKANWGIRATFLNPVIDYANGRYPRLTVRGKGTLKTGDRAACELRIPRRKDVNLVQVQTTELGTVSDKGVAHVTLSDEEWSKPIQLQLCAIGPRFTASVNGRLVGTFTMPELPTEGLMHLLSHGQVRDIEVINLDGLPEAEALRLLGVDEKGNDVRGKSAATPAAATTDAPFVNSLGMKFVPVPGTKVLFSIWETRVRDYAVFAKTNKVGDAWMKQDKDGVPIGREPEHPVCCMLWDEAKGFCQWLTETEIAAGKLPSGARYRLPTDEEWSRAVGLAPEQGGTPREKAARNTVDFPWGQDFPPKAKVGNFADMTFHEKFGNGQVSSYKWIEGYTDGFATTAPVGSFPANAFGLFDMSGNVNECCEDFADASKTGHVVRGGSWMDTSRGNFLSAMRTSTNPAYSWANYGFRCVLEPASPATSSVSPIPALAGSAAATKFPPGQWVKVTELSPDLQKPERGKFEDGWFKTADPSVVNSYVTGLEGRNAGIRATARIPSGTPIMGAITLQLRRISTTGSYQLVHDLNGMTIGHLAGKERTSLASSREVTVVNDMDVKLAFAAVGNRLVGWVNDRLVVTTEDSREANGFVGAAFRCWIRDVEVINLGGLSDAEALRILDVDKTGNDVRGKAGAK